MRTDLSFFVQVSILYQARFENHLWDRFTEPEGDGVAAACLFLEGYAFERQGRDPSYAHAAVAAVEKAKILPGRHLGQTVRNEFFIFLPGQKPNWKMSPLDHRDEQGCNCVWCVFDGENIVTATKQSMLNDQVKPIWERLQRIRGVGPKIASLFLRDVAVRYGLTPRAERHLLQPVDVWVRRTVHWMTNSNGMGDEHVAQWIVDECEKPELANQGIWYFGAQIAQSEFTLRKALGDRAWAWTAVQDHIASLEATLAAAKALRGWHNQCPS